MTGRPSALPHPLQPKTESKLALTSSLEVSKRSLTSLSEVSRCLLFHARGMGHIVIYLVAEGLRYQVVGGMGHLGQIVTPQKSQA